MQVAGAGFKDNSRPPEGDTAEITINCVKEKLIYDTKEFTVRQGQKVILTFKNTDHPSITSFRSQARVCR